MAASAITGESAPYYREVAGECAVFERAFELKTPLLLKGPTGCGKSRLVEYMAARLGRPLVTVACHDETSAVDLIGRYLLEGGETVWQDGPVTRAVRSGAILYLDEFAEARSDVVVVVHPLTDHRRMLFVDRHDETLVAPDDFMLVVSFNPGYQGGLKELKPSTRQRFVALSFDYPAAELETEIVIGETDVDANAARKLVGTRGQAAGDRGAGPGGATFDAPARERGASRSLGRSAPGCLQPRHRRSADR